MERLTAPWISEHFRAFPDLRHEIRGLAVESNQTLAFEWRHRNLRRASRDSRGRNSPNRKTIDIPGSDFWRFEGELIVQYHIYFDQLEFLRQLGLTPAT